MATNSLTDIELVRSIRCGDERAGAELYKRCYRYFMGRCDSMLSFKSDVVEPEDLFQDSFLILWNEIKTGKIHVRDNYMCRFDSEGKSRPMTASLLTYLMSIAKYKNFEILREAELFDYGEHAFAEDFVENAPEVTAEGIISQMVNAMPSHCREILTMYYYEGKSLDEILYIRNENTSKSGLKSGKSKCMAQLKGRIFDEFKKYNLKLPYRHE